MKDAEATPRPLGREVTVFQPGAQETERPVERAMQEPAGVIHLREALGLALMQNPELTTYAWEVRALEARRLQAGRLPNPVVEAMAEDIAGSNAGAGASDPIQPQTTIQLSQLIELGGKRAARQRLAEMDRRLATWDYEVARIEVFTRVAKAFTEALASQEAVALSERSLKVVEEVQRSVELRVQAGVVSPIEKTKAEVAVAVGRIETSRARRKLEADRRMLAALWGSAEPRFQAVAGDINVLPPFPRFDELQARLSRNPELARWAAEISQREALLALERSKRIPNVSVTAGYRRFNQLDAHSFLVGGSIELPIFDHNRGGIREAGIRVNKAREEQRTAQSRATTALAEAYRALATARDEVVALSSEVMPGARETFDAVSEGYRLGKFGYLEVLEAQRTLVAAGSQHLRALADYHKAAVEVERLIGAPLTDSVTHPPAGIQ